MEELKSCPFCGNNGHIDVCDGLGSDSYYPQCGTEKCVGNNGWVDFPTEEEAIKAWNTRAKEQE